MREDRPPYPFEHRDSTEDLIDYQEAVEKGEVSQLVRRWAKEDERAHQASEEIRKQEFRDQQMGNMVQSLEELKSAKPESGLDPETKATLASIKEFVDQAKNSQAELPTYLTKKELADFLSLAEKTVDKLVKQAILPEPKTISEKTSPSTKGRKIQRWKTAEVINQIDQY